MSPDGEADQGFGIGPGARYSSFLERLRARPVSSWRQGDRVAAARDAVAALARLAWVAERRPGTVPDVPDLGPHALADQVSVLLIDALRADADPHHVDRVVDSLADALSIPMS